MQNLIILSTQYKISDSSGNPIDGAENQLLMLNLQTFIIKFDMTVHYICIFCTHKGQQENFVQAPNKAPKFI